MNAMKTYPILLGWLCAIICGCTTAPLAETPVAETPVKEVPVAETPVEEATPPAAATPALPEQLFQLSQDARCRQVVTTCIVAGQPLLGFVMMTSFKTQISKQADYIIKVRSKNCCIESR
jgi:hypothetical protein